MSDDDAPGATRREKLDALLGVAAYSPRLTAGIVALGLLAAVLEGVGLSFILPIIELVGTEGQPATDGIGGLFVRAYRAVGVPLTLGTAVAGVAVVMAVRFASSFLVAWLREALRTYYVRDLQLRAFERALDARIAYYDEAGSDDVLNALVTQTFYAGRVIKRVVLFVEQSMLAFAYGLIALLVSPTLTVATAVVLGGVTLVVHRVVDSGYDVGAAVADANEQRQSAAQAGTQGIRDVRLFGLREEVYDTFRAAVERYTDARITLRRNEAAITNCYQFAVAVSVFGLVYAALTYAELSLGSLGLFLFAAFRLGPKASRAHELRYQVENDLPHLVRTRAFTEELDRHAEPDDGTAAVPERVTSVSFDDVTFAYDDGAPVLDGVSFTVEAGEFVAFVGSSGAGKSTIVSLLARLYDPDGGAIRANGTPITEMPIDGWREHVAVVRQDPYVFDDTLRYNLTLADRDATDAALERVCELARVDEFLDDLPNGYETRLGDDGVRLSGGQKQRVALARALLADADVLVLDEATSDLDSRLERDVQRAIESMERDYVVLTVAHRLSTVRNADRIYALADGRVVESGQHAELVEGDGVYADLYGAQRRD
ncbi:subfamily B ATP-binding cassette protein MsbA [Halarchaeum rubridurum]|uniref:ABC transporter n=1 Tax=Halarchaeum rubridurum TaxID=489911 RepID=A0A830FQC1_9EURY|nr:ABC transporter ATP-binding protein [Halarchaeum rubridurum]MBP1954380.1 subfamily B ATP-binding cassette protein MsbA [Halarchaeum rubridurum]GGM60497.1 ABC transporter [Halarchaeum rubridurum]